jgi:hypothetical protein
MVLTERARMSLALIRLARTQCFACAKLQQALKQKRHDETA